MNKIFPSIQQALADLSDGAVLMVGGMNEKGVPQTLLRAVSLKATRNLTVVSHDLGNHGRGVRILFEQHQVKKLISSSLGEDSLFEELVKKGELKIELNALGTFSERIRAGGAGIGAFYTPTAFATILAENKETRTFNGKNYILELPLSANFALVKAWKADRFGNLIYRTESRNFNSSMAAAAEVTIAEVEELVLPGPLDPNQVHTPGIYVQRIVQVDVPNPATDQAPQMSRDEIPMETQHQLIARRAAQELQDGGVVHLGKGIPSLVTQFVPSGIEVMVLDEAGQLSLLQSAVLPNGNTTQPISPEQDSPVDKACSFFSVEEAFVMIRGGHLDIAIMDADEVDESGNLANWMVPGKRVYGVGALMDLAVGGKRVVVAMEHKAKDQKPKILRNCRLPMTALGVVDRIITEMAVMDVTPEGLLLREIAPGLSVDEVTRSTEADLKVDKDLKMIQI